jgi:hypothetical protein
LGSRGSDHWKMKVEGPKASSGRQPNGGTERLDQTGERIEVGLPRGHARLLLNSFAKIRLAMIFAWSGPRAG